jgi:hypothetical protein
MCGDTRISYSDIPDIWFGYVIDRNTFIYLIGRNIDTFKLEVYDKKTYVIIDVIQYSNYFSYKWDLNKSHLTLNLSITLNVKDAYKLYNWNIVESGVKTTTPFTSDKIFLNTVLRFLLLRQLCFVFMYIPICNQNLQTAYDEKRNMAALNNFVLSDRR